MKITPLIIGSGNAGKAIARSLAILSVAEPRLGLQPVVWLERGTPLKQLAKKYEHPALFVANPHGLHARTLLEAHDAGLKALFCDKPSGVNPEEIQALAKIPFSVAIFHGYRQMWGPQTLKRMVDTGEFGEMVALEGRYWQASAAERALAPESKRPSKDWKNDAELSGTFDTLLDLGTHWLDLACFLCGTVPNSTEVWRSFTNAAAPHRDSHVQLTLQFPSGTRGFASISKMVHGATNHLEINLLGSLRSATWNFLSPDEIILGAGRDRSYVTRKPWEPGSLQSPHHGLGWLEGYFDICRQGLLEFFLDEKGRFPRLEENVKILHSLFHATGL